MDAMKISVLAILEAIGLIMIWRMWSKRQRSVFARCFWTVLLLVPLLGPLFYSFAGCSPEAHDESLNEYPHPGSGHF
jgi:hypothetical protein